MYKQEKSRDEAPPEDYTTSSLSNLSRGYSITNEWNTMNYKN